MTDLPVGVTRESNRQVPVEAAISTRNNYGDISKTVDPPKP